MLRRSFLGLAAAFGTAPFTGAPGADRRAAALEAHTRFLAHDLLEGRDTGSRGYDIAAAYVASAFAQAGLEPGGPNGDWFQPLTVRRRTLVDSEIGWIQDGGVSALVNGQDVAIDASATDIDETLELAMVFVGWGVDAPGSAHDDYAGLDIAGKAVVLLEGGPAELPPAVRAHYSWIQQKERMAAARGAVAVLTLKSPARERFSPWERTRLYRPLPAVGVVSEPDLSEAPPVRATLSLGPDFAQRLFRSAGRDLNELYREAETGRPAGFPLPGRIRIRRRSRHQDSISPNVIGRLPGRDPALRDEHLVLISHLDHVGVGPAIAGDSIYNGAVDNAGGVAVMLETARAMAARQAPRRSVLFVAVTGEERGLLGSDYFVRRPTVPLDRIAAAVSVDGLMAFHDFSGIVALGADHSTLGEISAEAAASVGAVHVPDPIPDRGNLALSDQYPFLRVGVPVLFPNPARGRTRAGTEDVAAWDDYEANAYHRPSDDLSLPLRWDVAARWTDYIEALAAGAAESRRRPMWYRDDPLAAVFAPDKPRAPRPQV